MPSGRSLRMRSDRMRTNSINKLKKFENFSILNLIFKFDDKGHFGFPFFGSFCYLSNKYIYLATFLIRTRLIALKR
jgi:hypothetical protein